MKQFHELVNYLHFMFFVVFKDLKSSFSEDILPIYATVVRQGMGIMHSDVMDAVFHSGDAWDSLP